MSSPLVRPEFMMEPRRVSITPSEIARRYQENWLEKATPRYNITPGTDIAL